MFKTELKSSTFAPPQRWCGPLLANGKSGQVSSFQSLACITFQEDWCLCNWIFHPELVSIASLGSGFAIDISGDNMKFLSAILVAWVLPNMAFAVPGQLF
jgi:hypothetical protein